MATNVNFSPTVKINRFKSFDGSYSWTVWIYYASAGVDRPCTHGICCGNDPGLAARLAYGITERSVFSNHRIVKDCHGKSYVEADNCLHTRELDHSLTELGI